MAILNVGKASLLGHSYKTLYEAVDNAIDGDIIQINMRKLVLDKPVQNFQTGVKVQGNPDNPPVEVFTPARNVGFYFGSGQTNVEFANLNFIVPEQANGISVSRGGSFSFDNVTMFHLGNLSERVIRPSLAFMMGDNPNSSLKLKNSAIDILSFQGAQFTMQSSNIGNILGASSFSTHTISVITAPLIQIQQSGVQHIGFTASYGNGMKPFEQPMSMSGSYLGANTIIQRSAMLNQMVLTPIVSVNQDRKHINYPRDRGYMPGLIVTGKDAKVSVDQVAIFDHFTKADAAKSVFANNYATVLNVVKNMVPFSPIELFNNGQLQIKNSQIPLTDGTNIAQSGKLILDHVTDQSMWDVQDSKAVELINRGSSSSLFQQSQQDDLLNGNAGQQQGAMDELKAMIGLKPVKEFAEDFVARMSMQVQREKAGLIKNKDDIQTMHAVFAGPAGTGKTTVAELFGRALYEAHVLPTPDVKKVSAADLVSNHVGETAQIVKRKIHEAFGGILFIDEAYVLAPDKNGGGNSFKDEAVTELVNEADEYRDKLMIIMAGYTNEMVDFFKRGNPGLQSRFGVNWINFPPYSIEELKQIMFLKFKQANVSIADAQTRQALEQGIDQLVGQQGQASGQGRFVRNYVEAVCSARDVRLMRQTRETGKQATPHDLMTVTAADAATAATKLGSRLSVFK